MFLNKWFTWINTLEQCYNSNISDANGFQRATLIFRFFNIKKMAANDRKRAMRNGQYWVFNNYSPKWRWIVVDIYRAARRRGKYPLLFIDTEVNNCFSIYHTSWINTRPKSNFIWKKAYSAGRLLRCRSRATRFFIVKCSVSPSCRQIRLLQVLFKLLRCHFLNGWV